MLLVTIVLKWPNNLKNALFYFSLSFFDKITFSHIFDQIVFAKIRKIVVKLTPKNIMIIIQIWLFVYKYFSCNDCNQLKSTADVPLLLFPLKSISATTFLLIVVETSICISLSLDYYDFFNIDVKWWIEKNIIRKVTSVNIAYLNCCYLYSRCSNDFNFFKGYW